MSGPTNAAREARKYGTDSPHEPTDEFVRRAFAEGARSLWPDSRDPGWIVTFDRWLAARVVEREPDASQHEAWCNGTGCGASGCEEPA